jgi:hypothetical protein
LVSRGAGQVEVRRGEVEPDSAVDLMHLEGIMGPDYFRVRDAVYKLYTSV